MDFAKNVPMDTYLAAAKRVYSTSSSSSSNYSQNGGMFSLIAAGVTAAAGIAGSVISAKNAKKNAQQAYLNQQSLDKQNAALNYQYNKQAWDEQNAYNTPANQKALYEAAGFKYSPNGESAAGAFDASIPTPQANAQEMANQENAATQYMMQNIQAGFGQSMQMIQMGKDFEMQKAQIHQMEVQNGVFEAQRNSIIENTFGQKLANEFAQSTNPLIKEGYEKNLSLMTENISAARFNNSILEQKALAMPEYFTAAKSIWKSAEWQHRSDALIRSIDAEGMKEFGSEIWKQRAEELKTSVQMMKQELRGLTVMNGDDMLQLYKDFQTRNYEILVNEKSISDEQKKYLVDGATVGETKYGGSLYQNYKIDVAAGYHSIADMWVRQGKTLKVDGGTFGRDKIYKGYQAEIELQSGELSTLKAEQGYRTNYAEFYGSRSTMALQFSAKQWQLYTGSGLNIAISRRLNQGVGSPMNAYGYQLVNAGGPTGAGYNAGF